MMGCDNEVDKLGMIGNNDMKRQFENVFDSDDNGEEIKNGFLMKNLGKISHEALFVVLGI
jgi:hypothetical protein